MRKRVVHLVQGNGGWGLYDTELTKYYNPYTNSWSLSKKEGCTFYKSSLEALAKGKNWGIIESNPPKSAKKKKPKCIKHNGLRHDYCGGT